MNTGSGSGTAVVASPPGGSASSMVVTTSPQQIIVPGGTCSPLDAAAHLKLLGESLSIIGARLHEHHVGIFLSYFFVQRKYILGLVVLMMLPGSDLTSNMIPLEVSHFLGLEKNLWS